MNADDRIQIDDGFHQFSISYRSLSIIIITIWMLWLLQLFLIFLFYATHPSSVSVNPKQYGEKLKVRVMEMTHLYHISGGHLRLPIQLLRMLQRQGLLWKLL